MKELLTLSAVVDELKSKIVWNHEMIAQAYGFFEDVVKHNNFLKGTVQLCHFIPCKDGKPLEKPEQNTPLESAQYRMLLHDYQQAQDAVIFEGWDWSKEKDSMSNGFYTIYKTPNSIIILTDNETGSIVIDTYSDLASATQGNPLKMRK